MFWNYLDFWFWRDFLVLGICFGGKCLFFYWEYFRDWGMLVFFVSCKFVFFV